MIVEAFKDSLELGLEKHAQIVVSIGHCATSWSVKMEVRLHLADVIMFIAFFYSNLHGDFSPDQ